MALDTAAPRSRRGLLLSGAAALGAAAAATLGRPFATRATQGNAVLAGVSGQTASFTTEVISSGGDGLDGTTSSSSGIGVVGYNSATSGETFGVMGRQTSVNDGSAVYGQADSGGTGVFGLSGAIYIASVTKTGVYGRTTINDANARGVWGQSDAGPGLFGTTTTGYALQTVGRLNIGTSGVATIPAGLTTATVFPGVEVTAGSFVLLTAAADIGARHLWYAKHVATDTFTIHLSSSRASATKVSWLLLG